jgi:hypothetical protein
MFRVNWLIILVAFAFSGLACSSAGVGVDAGQDAKFDADAGEDGDDAGADLGGDDGLDAGGDDAGNFGDAEEPGEDGGGNDGNAGDGDPGNDGAEDGGDGDGNGDDGGDAGGDEVVGWRSALYPEDWTPAFTDSQGRFLHDFSYAGYHYGEVPLPVVHGPLYDVVAAYGADNSGQADATQAIQDAIDAAQAAGGGVVHLPAGIYRLDGDLVVTGSNIILRGDGPFSTQLYFTRDQDMANRSNITLRGNVQSQLELPLAADAQSRATSVRVGDASGLSVGDDVQIGFVITDPFIADHGMDGTWVSFNGQWKPFFRRVVTGIDTAADPDVVELDIPLRYPALMRDQASIRKVSGFISECGVESMALSNAITYDTAWTFDRAHVLTLAQAKDCWIHNVHSFDSPVGEDDHHLQSCGIMVQSSKRVTVLGCRMEKAQHRGGGGNGYLFEVMTSNEVLVKECAAVAGRHNFIQNWDFGTNGCVFLRCQSRDGRMLMGTWDPIGVIGYCEYHHSLATANLVDSCTLQDGWIGYNRHSESSGAGHAVTQSVYWNNRGGGTIKSQQYQWGYVIGVNDMDVRTSLTDLEGLYNGAGTDPEDWVESSPDGTPLIPESLYEDQLRIRIE